MASQSILPVGQSSSQEDVSPNPNNNRLQTTLPSKYPLSKVKINDIHQFDKVQLLRDPAARLTFVFHGHDIDVHQNVRNFFIVIFHADPLMEVEKKFTKFFADYCYVSDCFLSVIGAQSALSERDYSNNVNVVIKTKD